MTTITGPVRWLIGLLIGAILVAIGMYIGKALPNSQMTTPTPLSSTSPQMTNSNTVQSSPISSAANNSPDITYTAADLGLHFQYPNGWKLNRLDNMDGTKTTRIILTSPQPVTSASAGGGDYNIDIEIYRDTKGTTDPRQFYDKVPLGNRQFSIKSVTINGLTGIQFSGDEADNPKYLFYANNQFYSFYFLENLIPNPSPAADVVTAEKLIMGSLSITKPSA